VNDLVDAGPFLPWLDEVRVAIRGEGETDVACGPCTACCESGQFVHIGPDEVDALAHVPKALRFPAPGRPKGHVLLPYDERGRCPMLGEDGCTIYEHRPQTCRTYDCRVFEAAGIDCDKPKIAERARQWAFRHPTPADEAAHDAVRRAAAALDPSLSPTERAVRAVRG
jgi:Fe-S-cluster containining protein